MFLLIYYKIELEVQSSRSTMPLIVDSYWICYEDLMKSKFYIFLSEFDVARARLEAAP